jgi:hypothetical protein
MKKSRCVLWAGKYAKLGKVVMWLMWFVASLSLWQQQAQSNISPSETAQQGDVTCFFLST